MTGSQKISNTTVSKNNPPPAIGTTIDGRYQASNRMFFGMSSFNLSRSVIRKWYTNTTEYADISQ